MKEEKPMPNFNLNQNIIEYYHNKSRKLGVNRDQKRIVKHVAGESLALIFETKHELIKVTEPFLYDLYHLVEDTGYLLELLDENGVILFMTGDASIIKEAAGQGMVVGARMDLESVGTNAISVAQGENRPCQLKGEDHYLEIFSRFTCSCAPIQDRSGQTIGFINLNGYGENVHRHTLGLVVAASNAIHQHLMYAYTISERELANRVTHSVMETVNFGILTIDDRGKIAFINTFAEKLLNDYTAVNRYVFDYFKGNELKQSLVNGIESSGVQYTLKASGAEVIIESHLMVRNDGSFNGYVMILKEIDKIIDIAGSYTDLKAKMFFGAMIAESPEMKNVVSQAKKISSSPSTIMILGEVGVGKSALAEAIHNHSNRKNLPFSSLTCKHKTEEAILYQLFGIAEDQRRNNAFKGKLNATVNGTLLLKDVDALTIKAQSMLLQYIRSSKAKKDRTFARIISTTTKDLEALIRTGSFNIELFYELSVIQLSVPPLRKRKEDIQAFIMLFLQVKSKQLGKPVTVPDHHVLKRLYAYEYKGNINELEQLVERIVNLHGKLDFDLNLKENQMVEKELINFSTEEYTLKEIEAVAIRNCLKKNDYNYQRTAKKLGISRATLYNKLKKINEGSV